MKRAKTDFNQTCLELATELSQQPALFSERGEPTAALDRYTGKRVANDDDRCLMAAALRLLQASDREIAAAVKCDVRSIPLMLRAAERSGRIPALKDRLVTMVGANAEASSIALQRLLDDSMHASPNDERAGMIKAVATALGISTEKYLLLTGSATEILEVRVAAGREDMEAWAKANAIPVEVSIDLESPAQVAKPQQMQACLDSGHGLVTTKATDAGPVVASRPGGGCRGGGRAAAGAGDGPNG